MTNNDAIAKIMARAQELAATTSTSSRKTPRECACGCGGHTKGGNWLPGHDAKMLSRMLREIRTGKVSAQAN